MKASQFCANLLNQEIIKSLLDTFAHWVPVLLVDLVVVVDNAPRLVDLCHGIPSFKFFQK